MIALANQLPTMNAHQLKDTINKTRMECLDWWSDTKSEKDQKQKQFLFTKVQELRKKYKELTGTDLPLPQ